MSTYVTLIKWTDQGARSAKDTVERSRQFRADLERRGGKLLSLYWTQGHYDVITTVEAPDDQTIMAALLAIGALGNVRTETLRAFNESEMEAILRKV
jgi:uncharacterized protein with GYD domain